jgi:hypothetical protein
VEHVADVVEVAATGVAGSPRTKSAPVPPLTTSLPLPAQTRSLPARPLIVSLPSPATITSLPAVPLITSLLMVPTIVAGTPKQAGGGPFWACRFRRPLVAANPSTLIRYVVPPWTGNVTRLRSPVPLSSSKATGLSVPSDAPV